MNFISALLLQFVAQRFLGVWGAAAAGLLTGVMFRARGAIRAAALSAALAAVVLLIASAERGADLSTFAAMVGKNFSVPGWAVFAATLVLPALQAGGFAGLISRVLSAQRAPSR